MTTKNTGHNDPTDPSTDSGQAPATGLTGSPPVESLLRQDSGGQAGQALRQRAEEQARGKAARMASQLANVCRRV